MSKRLPFWSHCIAGLNGCIIWIAFRNKSGYGALTANSRRWSAHRYAWTLANGPIPDGLDVLHRCDNPPCVNPGHLFIGTHQDNMTDAVLKKRHAHGERSSGAKLTETDIVEIRHLALAGIPGAEIASRFNISRGHVYNIKYGFFWKHSCSGERISHTRLTVDQVSELRHLIRDGVSIAAIAAQFNISKSHVWRIGRGKAWRQP